MIVPNLTILYVRDPATSAAFYSALLGRQPEHVFPAFVSYDLGNGFQLGLWSAHSLKPRPPASGNRSELAFSVHAGEVDRLYGEWQSLGVPIDEELHEAVFGPTFVGLDPDGHRLRVCTPDK